MKTVKTMQERFNDGDIPEPTLKNPIVGRGIFTWDGGERRSDRYGSFALVAHDEDSAVTTKGEKIVFSDFQANDEKAFVNLDDIKLLVGQEVLIQVKVIETRESRHIGDMFRGISPSTPELHTIITLGPGTLFIKHSTWAHGECCGDVFIGLEPNDGRDSDWLDPHKLYKLHNQTVEITINQEKSNAS